MTRSRKDSICHTEGKREYEPPQGKAFSLYGLWFDQPRESSRCVEQKRLLLAVARYKRMKFMSIASLCRLR
jgi:hypothetical protein